VKFAAVICCDLRCKVASFKKQNTLWSLLRVDSVAEQDVFLGFSLTTKFAASRWAPTSDDGIADDAHEAGVLALPQEHRLQRPPRGVELDALVFHDLRRDGGTALNVPFKRCAVGNHRRREQVSAADHWPRSFSFSSFRGTGSSSWTTMVRRSKGIPLCSVWEARTFAAMVWPRHVPRNTRP